MTDQYKSIIIVLLSSQAISRLSYVMVENIFYLLLFTKDFSFQIPFVL